MVAWFLIAISTIAFFAYIAVSGVQTVDTTGTVSARADTIRRIDLVAEALTKRSASITGNSVIYAPAGVASANGYLLPEDLQPLGTTNFGSAFQYCPMGDTLTSAATESVVYAGGAYNARSETVIGKRFVTQGRPAITAAADQNIIGFVMAQLSPVSAKPGCGQITLSGTAFTAPNGIVRAVRRSATAENSANTAANGMTWYVSPRGNGTGLNWSSPASLSDALAAYRASPGGTFSINFGSGEYFIQGSPIDGSLTQMAQKKSASNLVLIGQGNTSVSFGNINVPSDIEIRSLLMPSANITADNGTSLRIINSAVGSVIANNGSHVHTYGENSIKGTSAYAGAFQLLASSHATVNNGLTIYYPASKPGMIVDSGSSATFVVANVTLQPADSAAAGNAVPNAVIVNPDAKLTAKYTTFNLNGPSSWAFVVLGKMATFETSLLFNSQTHVGIQTAAGSDLALNNITIRGSSPPTYGLAPEGVGQISASGNIWSGYRCWWRGRSTVLRMSSLGATGDNADVSPDEAWATMNAQPTAQQVRDYQAMRQRNAERADLRRRVSNIGGTLNCQAGAAPSWTSCAAEGGQCNLPADAASGDASYLVRYGAGSSYRYVVTRSNMPCNVAAFGDPSVGTTKSCSYSQ